MCLTIIFAMCRRFVQHFPRPRRMAIVTGTLSGLLLTATSLRAQTWNLGTGGSWNSSANWNPAAVPNGTGVSVTFNNAASASNPAQTGNSTVSLDGSKTVGSLSFNNDAPNAFNYTIATGSGGPLIFDAAGSGPATLVLNSVASATGNNTISVATTLADSLVVTVNNVTATSAAGALNLTTVMSGSGGFTKQGDGLATIGSAVKTYTGPTILSGGRTRITQAGQPALTSSFTVSPGAQLTLNTAGGYAFGTGNLNLNGSGATSGPYAIFPGAMRNDRGIAPITISNAIVLQSDTLIHVQANNGTGSSSTPAATNTLAGNITGPGKLTLTAPNSDVDQGILVLLGANSYSGGTLVNGGILEAGSPGATFGTGDVIIDHAASPSSIARAHIRSGVLNAVADTATLSLSGGGAAATADQGFIILDTGVNEEVGALKLAGVFQPPGTYGSTASAAGFQSDEFFSGPGMITVPGRPALSISPAPPNVILSWPTNAIGFVLQAANVLAGIWTNDSTLKTVNGTNYNVSESASGTNTFFRLSK
jgi:autotransporter-associated beta strand protein